MAEMIENLMRLRAVDGCGCVTQKRLLDEFGTAEAVLGSSAADLCARADIGPALAERILRGAAFDPRPEMERAVAAGVDIIPYDDPRFPTMLQYIPDRPSLLYVRGQLLPADNAAIGIVGTRMCTKYGREQARHFAAVLSLSGLTVVSGLARGIDTMAHTGALSAGGRTIGVLGCGLDHIYPEENRDLAVEMCANGALISEYPMDTAPTRETFPARNRIIAGMSAGVLIVEAPEKSGALITAKNAIDIGRSVFVLPGRVTDSASIGCNRLLSLGAAAALGPADIIAALRPTLGAAPQPPEPKPRRRIEASGRLFASEAPAEQQAAPDMPPDQQVVLAALGAEPRTVDDIIEATGLPPGRVTAALALLTLANRAVAAPGMCYVKA